MRAFGIRVLKRLGLWGNAFVGLNLLWHILPLPFWLKYNMAWELGFKKYESGDIVTRDGSDLQIIIDIEYNSLIMTVECIKEPQLLPPVEEGDVPWIRKGEQEWNMICRYQLVRKAKKLSQPYFRINFLTPKVKKTR